MKLKRVLILANCARDPLKVCFNLTNPKIEVKTFFNVTKDGLAGFMREAPKFQPDLVLFQTFRMERADFLLPGKGFPAFVKELRKQHRFITWVHPHNTALWPWTVKIPAEIVDDGNRDWRGAYRLVPEEVRHLHAQAKNLDEARKAWDADALDFDFARRLKATQAHHADNERHHRPTILLGDFLKARYRSTNLWLSPSHPTSTVHLELFRRICELTGQLFSLEPFKGLPGEWVKADDAWPHSRYDHAFHKFAFCTKDLVRTADCYWKGRLKEVWPE